MALYAVEEGRIRNLVWLTIDDQVLNFACLFSDMNATANDATVDDDVRTALESDDPQAEVLVRGYVAARWITFES
jgi:hypothetical protein